MTQSSCEEDACQQGILNRIGLEWAHQPGIELSASRLRQAVHPPIRSAALRDDSRRYCAVSLKAVEGAIDLGLVGVPEVNDRAVESSVEVIAALRLTGQQPKDGVSESHVLTVCEHDPATPIASRDLLR